MRLIHVMFGVFVIALALSVYALVTLGNKVQKEWSTPHPAALIKQHDKVYHGCVIYTISGGVRVRVEGGKQMILMGELTIEDDPDYYCTDDHKGPHPK